MSQQEPKYKQEFALHPESLIEGAERLYQMETTYSTYLADEMVAAFVRSLKDPENRMHYEWGKELDRITDLRDISEGRE